MTMYNEDEELFCRTMHAMGAYQAREGVAKMSERILTIYLKFV